MLVWWRATISTVIAQEIRTSVMGRPITIVPIATIGVPTIAPTNEWPDSFALPIQTASAIGARIGQAPIVRPPKQATPLPPRLDRTSGKTCPTTAAAPHAAARVVSPAQWPNSVATRALSTSITNVAPPARRPAMRNMLVAPGFPEPSCMGLWPTMRPIRSADGKVPKKNAPKTRNQTKFTAASLAAELCQRTNITVRLVDSTSSSNKHSLKTPSKNARRRSLDAAPKAAPRAGVARY
jgi:hypothetical protein